MNLNYNALKDDRIMESVVWEVTTAEKWRIFLQWSSFQHWKRRRRDLADTF